MYCLEKLQRELAHFFDMDLRELPRVQELLQAQGYTQIRKGDEIIKLKTSLDTPKKSQREQVKQQLQSIKNKDITHKSGIVARLSGTGIDKMLSDKAIQKSVDNGFSLEQHFNAVADIERLFKNSDFSHTEAPKNHSTDIVGIHRYINAQDLQDQNAQALITLKESVENGNRIYSVELEGLAHPSSVDRSPKSKGVENSHHDDAGATKAARLFENPSDIIPQSTATLSTHAQDHAHQILQGLRKTAQTPLNKLADEVHSTDRGFMLREARYIKQQAQELADNFANLRWQDLRAAMRYAKVPYNEAMFKELKAGIESKEFARFIESRYPTKPTQTSLFDTDTHAQATTPTPQQTIKLDSSLPYTDTQGHTHQIPTDIAQKWLETFDLKDLQEAYTPQFSEQVAKALEPILQGSQITLSANSLIKLMQRDRLEFLPYIKETLETPNAVVRQVDGAIIFAKDYRDEKLGKFFASVSKNDKGEWVISSNAPKKLNNLQNKIKEGGEVLYSDLPELPIIAKPDLTAKALNSEANQDDIIPQQTLESTMEKFNYDEKKARDLLEWHKDSSPLTKDENGMPKVFYHGSRAEFEVFKKEFDKEKNGFWFADREIIAERFANDNDGDVIYPVFLKMKNPIWLTYQKDGGKWVFDWLDDEGKTLLKEAQKQGLSIDFERKDFKFKEFLESKGYDGLILKTKINGILYYSVFDSNQIKHIDNKGSYTDPSGNITKDKPKGVESTHTYFNENSPNIYQSSPHAGAGLLGGSAAGFDTDENGNITFSPEKFALGLLGGVVGSKAVAKGLEWRANKVAKSYPNIAKDNPALMSEIAKRDLATYARTNAHNTLTRFLNNNKILDVNPQLFAGEKALLNEAYAPHKARLEKAKELESKGADEIEIWEKTGWYKDKDSKWKFEISQRGGELRDDFESYMRENYPIKLYDILKDDELFKAYPALKDVGVKYGKYTEYDPRFMSITIKNGKDRYDALNLLYHEIQHAVQQIEGFAVGSGEGSVYHHTASYGEIEARNVEKRMLDKPSKKHPHLTSELQEKEQEKAIKSFNKYEATQKKLEALRKDIEQRKEYLYDYSNNARYKSEVYNKKAEVIHKKERKVDDLELELEKIERDIPNFWTGEAYRDKSWDIKEHYPIIESFNDYDKNALKFADEKHRLAVEFQKRWGHNGRELEKEQKGIYNVAFNGKNATLIKQDLESVENAIAFMQGTRYKGAKHERIKHLTDPSKEGYVTDLELVNLGKSIREYLAKHKEPFIDTNGARIYEWEKDGVRFRVVVNDVADMDSNPTTATQEIITFYSDRNLKEKMKFKNPTLVENTMHGEALSKELTNKVKNTLESKAKAQGQDLDLFNTFVENGRIKESALNHYAKKLPKTLNEQEFLAQILHKDKQGYSTIQTPIGQIQVNLQHAWNHLHKGNTYKKDRSLYSGAFLDTLADPLFIVKQEYTPSPKVSANAKEMQNSKLVQTRDTKSIAQDSYVFFKPYKIKDKYTYMVGYALDIQGNIINTTFIPMTSRDFGRIKKMFSSQVLYINL